MLRPARTALALLVALSLLTACDGETREEESKRALDLVPANAAMYTEIAIEPSEGQQAAVEEIARRFPREARKGLLERLRSIYDDTLPPLHVDYADLEPWLGDTVADFVVTEVVDDFHVFLLAVEEGAANPEKTFTKGMEESSKESYRGIDYVSGLGFDGATYEVGLFEGFVVVAQDGGFAATVDASVSESLETTPEFQQAVGAVEADALATLYVDIRSLQNEPTLEDQMTQEEFRSAGILGNGVVAATVSAREDAVVARVSSGFDEGGLLAPVLRGYRGGETLSELPGHAWFAARVPKIKALVRAVMTLTGAKQKAGWRQFDRGLERGRISFRKGLLSWMRDGTIYVGGRFPSIDVGLSVESSSPRKTARFVRLLAVLLRRGGARVTGLPSVATHTDFALHPPQLPQSLQFSGAQTFTVTYGRPLNQVYREEGFLDGSEDFVSALEMLDDRYALTLFVDGDQARRFGEDTVTVTRGLLPDAYVDEAQSFIAQGDYLVHGVDVEGDRILQQIVIGVR